MGTCFSKKSTSIPPPLPDPTPNQTKPKTLTLTQYQQPHNKNPIEEDNDNNNHCSKKGIFVIKHQNSHEIDPKPDPQQQIPNSGKPSRSSSASKKRSYDLDNEIMIIPDYEKGKNSSGIVYNEDDLFGDGDEVSLADRIHLHRRSRSSSSSRRRTPSRERGGGGGNGGRRVSKSPSRRSESPVSGTTSTNSGNTGANTANNNYNSRPGKMVSVPATVGVGGENTTIKRISVKRNVGNPPLVCRSASQSPAKLRGGNVEQKQAFSLSRGNSRKREYSPYRRNALDDIDQNCFGKEEHVPFQRTNGENLKNNRVTNNKTNMGKINMENKVVYPRTRETEDQQMEDESEESESMTANVSGAESLKSQAITRSRSSRLSRDLDLSLDILLNPAPSSYTARLLEDIQNFHQKNSPAISLPPCVSKAQSIVEAVADLNSGTRSNFYAGLSDQRRINSTLVALSKIDDKYHYNVNDDLSEPNFEKYVTVKRGTVDMEDEEESSGSNSFVSGQQHWVSSSSWEPNSAESTGYCTSSRSDSREDNKIPISFKGHIFSESRLNLEEKKREIDQQQRCGIGRYRVSSG